MRVLLFLSILLISNVAFASGSVDHVRVIWHENPARESIIAWSADKLCKKGTLYLDTVSRNRRLDQYKITVPSKKKWYTGTTDMRHSVLLEGLNPNTIYYFVIKNDDVISREYYFKTAPDGDEEFKLLFGGDSRSDRTMRRKVNLFIKSLIEKNNNLIGLVHGGDFISNGMSWKLWKEWLSDLQLSYGNDGRVLPIIPTRGNHEYLSPLFNDVFQRPGDKIYKNYFRSRLGNLSILTLNTNISFSGFQKKWLENNLIESVKDSRWIFANYHRPAYPAVKKPGGALKHWVPLFEKYLIDLSFESDGHTLKKTVPIFQGQQNLKKGIIYIGEGGMGVKQRVPTKTNEWYLQSPGYAVSNHHVILTHVKEDKVDVSVNLIDGSVFDSFTLSVRDRSKL